MAEDSHAVTITGYRADPSLGSLPIGAVMSQSSNRIHKLYAHDDGIGPFARMALQLTGTPDSGAGAVRETLSTEWPASRRGRAVRAIPEVLLVPLHDSIRIPAEHILDRLLDLDGLIAEWLDDTDLAGRVEWDVTISSVNDLKRAISQSTSIDPDERRRILTMGFPRYVWRAQLLLDRTPALELCFDTTDLEQSNLIIAIVGHDPAFAMSIQAYAQETLADPEKRQEVRRGGAEPIIELLASIPTAINRVADTARAERIDISTRADADGMVTLMFTDIEGSTAHNETMGDERWMESLRAHNAILDAVIAVHAGHTVKTMGDGYMVTFPTPIAAVSCAVAIQSRLAAEASVPNTVELKVRIGVHLGRVVREGDDFFGREVNFAQRVANAAVGGEIRVSEAVFARTRSKFEFGEPVLLEMKGFVGIHGVYPVAR